MPHTKTECPWEGQFSCDPLGGKWTLSRGCAMTVRVSVKNVLSWCINPIAMRSGVGVESVHTQLKGLSLEERLR